MDRTRSPSHSGKKKVKVELDDEVPRFSKKLWKRIREIGFRGEFEMLPGGNVLRIKAVEIVHAKELSPELSAEVDALIAEEE